MFSSPIFRQSIRSNYILWLVCTVVLTAMLCLVAAFHDPSKLAGFMEAIEDTAVAAEAGDDLDMFSSLLGILTQTIYGFSGIMIALVYVVVTANSLVASEVDRGSMAYTLSTPTKRSSVIFTKATYLIVSVVAMFAIIAAAGTATIQVRHHAIWGERYTADVAAAAGVLGLEKSEVAGHLYLIAGNDAAFAAGRQARGLDPSVYGAYLTLAMQRDAYAAAAEVLGVDTDEIEDSPAMVKSDPAALAAAAAATGTDTATYGAQLDQVIAQAEQLESMEQALQTAFTDALAAAAKHLGMETGTLAADLGLIKQNPEARAAALQASGLDELTFTLALDQAIAANEISADLPVKFDPLAFLMMNLGILLLMFAVSGISFLASCVFNLSKHSLALGAGLPFAFLILNLLSTVNDTLAPLKYFSIVTLFDTEQIMKGGTYAVQFLILAVIGVMLYVFATRVFKRKDLPL